MASITESFKDIFLAGVGALSLGAEKSKEVIDQLVDRGEITVEQGKKVASNLQGMAADEVSDLRENIIKAQMKYMSKDQRDAYVARIAELAAQIDADSELEKEEAEEVETMAEEGN